VEHFVSGAQIWLIPLGFAVGLYGTLIGVGGGFVLVPALLLLYPDTNPDAITSISLAVVFFNALSGSCAYARMRRIDYKSGMLLASTTIPGAILGALSTGYVPRRLFDLIFGILMISASFFLLFYRIEERKVVDREGNHRFVRSIVEKDGTVHVFQYDPRIAVGFGLFAGYISSLLGIGGGIIHMPVLIRFLNFPVHVATATSHFVLAIMALTGTIVHIVGGSLSQGVYQTIALAIGVILGAQLGAILSGRIHGIWIVRFLAIALAFVGIRILIMAL
jgi:uncharacterized membrane protein YfcA